MHTIASMLLAAIVALSAISLTTTQQANAQQTQTTSEISGGFANVQTVQNDNHIIITVTKVGGEAPTGPIVVPDVNAGDNATIIVPNENATDPETNATDIIIIEPNGNVTSVPNGNVTNVNNSTVVVAPNNQTVTETPGGAVVVDAPVCGCPAEPVAPEDATTTFPGAPAEADDNATQLEDNITATLPVEPMPTEPSGEEETNGDNGSNGSNGNNGEDNGTSNPFLGTPE